MAAVLAGGFYANGSGRRLFAWAMAGSLALHLALLSILPLLQDAQRAQPMSAPLTARLAKPKPPPEPAPPKTEPPPQAAARPRPAPVAKAEPRPVPVPAPQAPVPTPPARMLSVEPAKQAAEPVHVVPATPAAPVAAPAARPEPAPAAQPGASAGGPDPGTVARYRLELMDLARRYKKYPRIAQDNNWEGRVELRIAIGETGAVSSLTVKKSAGHAVLDDEAQAMIRTASARAAVPPALRGKAFALEIPVDFFLKDDEK
jgi:protein TonB